MHLNPVKGRIPKGNGREGKGIGGQGEGGENREESKGTLHFCKLITTPTLNLWESE